MFPLLPTSELALALWPPFPWCFICGEDLKLLKNGSLEPAKQVTLTKHNIYSFKGHFHVDIDHVKVLSPIHEGEESKRYLRSTYLIILLILFYIGRCMFSTIEYRKSKRDASNAVVASKKEGKERNNSTERETGLL